MSYNTFVEDLSDWVGKQVLNLKFLASIFIMLTPTVADWEGTPSSAFCRFFGGFWVRKWG